MRCMDFLQEYIGIYVQVDGGDCRIAGGCCQMSTLHDDKAIHNFELDVRHMT